MKYDTEAIDAIRCYQSVMFDKRQETYFATRQINEKLALEIEILEKIPHITEGLQDQIRSIFSPERTPKWFLIEVSL